VKYVLHYETAQGGLEKAPQHFPAHRERWQKFVAAGTLLMVGPFTDGKGAIAIFTTREAAEGFAKEDPFVVNGVVALWEVREWAEALVP
jgi:uncharacterized protein YciI